MRPEPCTKSYKQLRNVGSRRNSLPQGRSFQFVIQKRIVTLSTLKTYIKVKGYIRQIDQEIYISPDIYNIQYNNQSLININY